MIYFIMTANIENVVKSQSLLRIPHTIKHRIVGIFEVQLQMIQGSKVQIIFPHKKTYDLP